MNTLHVMIFLPLYMAFCIGTYYFIFHKHHKRNKVEEFELVELFTNYFVTLSMSILIFAVGIYFFKVAYDVLYDRALMIKYIIIAIAIISGVIINFYFYIKRNLKDFNPEARVNYKNRVIRVGEILELVCFSILALMPLWRINNLIILYRFNEREEFLETLFFSFVMTIVSVFLLYNLNPLDIREKIKDKFGKKEENASVDENKAEEKVEENGLKEEGKTEEDRDDKEDKEA